MFKNIDQLMQKFNKMEVGEKLVYHTGFLCNDRLARHGLSSQDQLRCKRVAELGAYFLDLFTYGKCHLAQNKIAEKLYEYVAIKQ